MSGLRSTLIAGAVALVFALLFLTKCQEARTAGAEARLGNAVAGAAVESGQDAVQAAGAVSASETAYDSIGRQNDAEIRSAAGAGEAVPAAVDAATRAGLCRRAAYRGDPKCLQRAAP
jgi:hypothetical protein